MAKKRSGLDLSSKASFGEHVLDFNRWLAGVRLKLPKGVTLLRPFTDPEVNRVNDLFYSRFFGDENARRFLLGINPGRLGAGITGIPFTDPVSLEQDCAISNSFNKRPELSSDFIYRMIEAMGGTVHFYRRFFVTSVCPLGFMKEDVNLNFYDDKELIASTDAFIRRSMARQLEFGCDRSVAFILGEGKLFDYFSKVNLEEGYFSELVPLPHPRFVMQYRRKKLDDFIELYCQKLNN
ncbi:MAG: uracil-DNA glycosylase family protein [Bacteroidota bacterium]